MNSLPKTAARQRRGCDLNPGSSELESSMITTPLLNHPTSDQSNLTFDISSYGRCAWIIQSYSLCTVLPEPHGPIGWR